VGIFFVVFLVMLSEFILIYVLYKFSRPHDSIQIIIDINGHMALEQGSQRDSAEVNIHHTNEVHLSRSYIKQFN